MKTKIRFSKQILSILLCLAMLMSYVPLTALAAEYDAWSNGETLFDGTYDLGGATITITGPLVIAGTVTVQNGTIQRGTGYAGGEMFFVNAGKSLTLDGITIDGGAVWCGAVDNVLGRGTTNIGATNSSELIYVGVESTAVLSNCTLQNNECNESGGGGAISVDAKGSLTAINTTMCNNAKTQGQAGAIKAYTGATVTLTGCALYGNEAITHGGAIQIWGGNSPGNIVHMTMTNCTVRNNKAGGVGGGIAVSDYSDFTMIGGIITDNATTDYSKRGGGVGFRDKNTSMSISGDAVISGNVAIADVNNLYVGTNDCNKLAVGEMGSSANVGVTMASAGVFSSGGASYSAQFKSDNAAYEVAADGNDLKLVAASTSIYTVTYKRSDSSGTLGSVKVAAGEYTLPAYTFTPPTGKQFKGWSTEANGEVITTGTITVSGNTTLYAIWEDAPAVPHTHSFVYTAWGSTIVATCVAGDCPLENGDGGSITLVAPTTDLTYDNTAKEATYTSTLVTGDEINIVYASVDNADALVDGKPVYAGDYTASITLGEGNDAKTVSVNFTIEQQTMGAPVGLAAVDETISKQANGKIAGLTTAMEYSTSEYGTYTKITDPNMEFAAGTYYVRTAALDDNYVPSDVVKITINIGRKLNVTIPQNQIGYVLTVNKTELDYDDTVRITFKLLDGYSMVDDNFAVTFNGVSLPFDRHNQVDLTDCTEDIVIEVNGVADTTPPMAEISIEENKWTSFWNSLTFGKFFRETQDITITADDKGSEVNTIQYYLANGELELREVKELSDADWQDYNGSLKITPDNKYVVYVKIVDNAGNISYINSDNIVLDSTIPALVGITNGEDYYGDKVFKVLDDYLKALNVNGVDVTDQLNGDNEYKIIADNAEHTIIATDEAGNVTEYKITVYKNYTVTYKFDGNDLSTETVGHGKDAALPTIPAKEGYVGKWDADGKAITADTVISVVYTAVEKVDPEQVKPEDKTELEDAKKQLEDMLDDDSYTEDDKKEIQDAIDSIDDALKVIENVENVEELIDKISENITKNATAAIKAADDAYNALSDYEKSLVNEDAKKALDDAKAALAELNKPADPNSPQTGDNSNLWLWIALLFISSAGIFGITVYDRKRKATSKR